MSKMKIPAKKRLFWYLKDGLGSAGRHPKGNRHLIRNNEFKKGEKR
jgi:hypothetical protein